MHVICIQWIWEKLVNKKALKILRQGIKKPHYKIERLFRAGEGSRTPTPRGTRS